MNKFKKSFFIFLALAMFGPFEFFYEVKAQNNLQREQKQYAKCYALFTDNPIDLNDSLLIQITNGQITANIACRQLLEKARLVNHRLPTTSGPDFEIGKNILRTWTAFHRSWFGQVNGWDGHENLQWTFVERDEEALFFSKALFDPNFTISDTVTANIRLRGRRVPYLPQASGWVGPRSIQNREIIDPNSSGNLSHSNHHLHTWMNDPNYRIMWGPLIGIEPATWTQGLNYPNWNQTYTYPANYLNGVGHFWSRPFWNKGGGLLGSDAFLIKNSDFTKTNNYDRGLAVNRRLFERFLKYMFDREGPPIRTSDAGAFVEPTSSLPFGSSAVCMSCHASYDPGAGAFSDVAIRDGRTGSFVGEYTNTDMPGIYSQLSNWLPTFPQTNYHDYFFHDGHIYNYGRQNLLRFLPPQGTLRLRQISGNYLEVPVNGIAEMGQAVAGTLDFYAMVTKRYFKYLTGVNVTLQDPVKITRNAIETEHYNYVLALAQQLQQHQDPMQLVFAIVEGPYFMNPYYLNP